MVLGITFFIFFYDWSWKKKVLEHQFFCKYNLFYKQLEFFMFGKTKHTNWFLLTKTQKIIEMFKKEKSICTIVDNSSKLTQFNPTHSTQISLQMRGAQYLGRKQKLNPSLSAPARVPIIYSSIPSSWKLIPLSSVELSFVSPAGLSAI